MAKKETASCEGDDWLVVGCDDGSHAQPEDACEGVQEKQRLEVQNQILDSNGTEEEGATSSEEEAQELLSEEESDSNQTTLQQQHWSRFQLLVWHSGLKEPIELVDEHHKPLVVSADSGCFLQDLQRMLHEMIISQPQLRGVFPQVTRENVSDVVQVCERSGESMPWMPLASVTETQELYKTEKVDDDSAARLQLTSQMELHGNQELGQLLVESKFEVPRGGELTDWRRGRFYSNIQEVAWRFHLQIGQLVDALDTDRRWYESRVVDMDAVYVKVHYRGWTSKWDEWMRRTSGRLAPQHTKVPNWRAFQAGDEVMVGSEVPGKKYPEWRDACVTACDKEDGLLQIEVEVDGKKKWLDAQDELICPKGTHKAVNAGEKGATKMLVVPPSLLSNYFERPEHLPSPRPQEDEAVSQVDSLREATHAVDLASSDADGDEWCVVDDDCEEEDAATTEGNNEADTTVAESAATASQISDASSASADPAVNNQIVVPPTIDQMFATTTEVLDGQMDSTISEQDAWRYQLQIDQLIDARDTDNVWYESRVVALSSTLVKLHYRGWTSKWDEWIERTSTRIAPLHTKVRNWRDLKAGNTVMVGRNVATKRYPEWRNAIVTACEACEVDGRLRIEVDVDGSKQWMDAQDEMLCPPGTHKAVNSSMLKHMVQLL
ncbi:hypothetical protein KRP22_006339 [Phytophthora ramorum]|nr:hypothetical protein KRP22_2528 [Phytophthora ramorum]